MPENEDAKNPDDVKKPRPSKPFTVTILIPTELGLTQDQVDLHLDKFMVEMAGTLGTDTPQIVIQALDAPPNDY
jgi:hypothetical protein